MRLYKDVSEQVFAIFRRFTPIVEGLSLDEAFLDVSGSRTLFGEPQAIARQIKSSIATETQLTASVGVAPNKLVAKIASDLDKPDGLVVVTRDNLHRVLDPLPVQVIPGIGRETLTRLHKVGIRQVADLRQADDRQLEPIFGRFAQRARERAAGIDDRQVSPSRADKSISAEETYAEDLTSVPAMQRELLRLTERTARRLRAKSLTAGTVQIKIRQSDFTTHTRQHTLQPPSNSTDALFDVVRDLLREWLAEHAGARIRLFGVGVSRFSDHDQQDLFAPRASARGNALDQTVDEIRDRFGDVPIGRARGLGSDQIR